MKYLYKILRLFFCPHKYAIFYTVKLTNRDYYPDGRAVGWQYISKCRYCGKITSKIT